MKITLFGGTFDPPHLGHSQIARTLLEQNLADEVWFLPVGEHAFEKKCSPAETRVALLELVLAEHQRIELYEIEQQGMSITYDTLRALSKKYPQHQFAFVIGSDNLEKFHLWHHYQEMLHAFPFFVYPREGYSLAPLYENMHVLTQVPPVTISSTQIRAAAKSGASLENLVKPAVAEYIAEHTIYQ